MKTRNASRVGREVEVLEVRELSGSLYFKVNFGRETKMVARDLMRRFYPLELIEFYEKNIQFT